MNVYEHVDYNPNYYIVGIDYGTSNATAAVLCAVTPRQWPQIHIEQEYYWDSAKKGRQKTDDELAEDIKNFIGYKSVKAVYVDPSAASLKLELRNRNIPVLDAKNDVLEGIKVTAKFITNKSIVIHKSCTTLTDCIQSYIWDAKASDRGVDKPLKVREHIIDATRYAVYSAFPHGDFGHPDENLTIEQIKRQIYGDAPIMMAEQTGGYY